MASLTSLIAIEPKKTICLSLHLLAYNYVCVTVITINSACNVEDVIGALFDSLWSIVMSVS